MLGPELLLWIEAGAVVGHGQTQPAVAEQEGDVHPGRTRMTLGVGDGLLGDADAASSTAGGRRTTVPSTVNELWKPWRSVASVRIWLMDATRPRSSRTDSHIPLAMEQSCATVSSTEARIEASIPPSRRSGRH